MEILGEEMVVAMMEEMMIERIRMYPQISEDLQDLQTLQDLQALLPIRDQRHERIIQKARETLRLN